MKSHNQNLNAGMMLQNQTLSFFCLFVLSFFLLMEVADLMEWTLRNDSNGIVKHEACYQIGARNMRSKIPVLIDASLNDKSILTKHEAIESLGLMRAFESIDLIRDAEVDPNIDVRETARFVIKRLNRLKDHGDYKPSIIL